MSAEEIESYKFQLEQVELALASDPENEELTKLQHDLKELIQMFEAAQAISQQEQQQQKTTAPRSVPSTALKNHEFSVDQEVMARYSGDGQFYKATITAIGGADQVFSVKFKGYSESEFVNADDIKAIVDKKRVGIFENMEGGNKNKKRKESTATGIKDASVPNAPKKKKAVEFENKKNAWLNFATGSSKKKKTTPINKKSIFKTPDNPEGKGE